MKLKYLIFTIFLFYCTSLFSKEINVSIYNYINNSKNDQYEFLSKMIPEIIIDKVKNSKNINVKSKKNDDNIKNILLTANIVDKTIMIEELLNDKSEFIVFGSFRIDDISGKIIVKTYIYNSSGNVFIFNSKKTKLFEDEEFSADGGTLLVKNLEPLSEKYLQYFLKNSDNHNFSKVYNGCIYELFNGFIFEYNYGYMTFTGKSRKGLKSTFSNEINIIYNFYDDGILQDYSFFNVSGFGLKYITYPVESDNDVNDEFIVFGNSITLNYYLFFRPLDYFHISFLAGFGITNFEMYNSPETYITDDNDDEMHENMVIIGSDIRFIYKHIFISTGVTYFTIFDSGPSGDLTGYNIHVGSGFRF